MYEAKGELTDQNEAVARLDAELEELNQKYKDMERTQKVFVLVRSSSQSSSRSESQLAS